MTPTAEYQVGDRVRLTCDLPVAPAGTEGLVTAVHRDEQQLVQSLVILIADDPAHTCGTGVFPREVELVGPSLCEVAAHPQTVG